VVRRFASRSLHSLTVRNPACLPGILQRIFRVYAPSALVRIMKVPASHFRNRVGGRITLVFCEKILSARELSNPRPCLFRAGEAEVL
jgi:hypothetical protein